MTVHYTKDHEYVRVEGDTATIGITDFAQQQLGDVVFVELPNVGKAVKQGAEAAVVESVKAASEVYAPVSGEIVAVNESLKNHPEAVNKDPHSTWMIRVKVAGPSEGSDLLDSAQYQGLLG